LMGASGLLVACGDDCVPEFVQNDEIIYLSIVRNDGRSIIRYPGNALPGDSVRITNLDSARPTPRYMIRDSILAIESYNKNNNAVNNFKIEVGAPGVRKPDTLQITSVKVNIIDNCGREIPVTRFGTLKVNNVTRCTNCTYNQIYTIQKPF
jgi:hypothetical protein